MATTADLNLKELQEIAENVARALSCVRIEGHSAYINTAVSYPNGDSVVVRLEAVRNGFRLSDASQAAFYANLAGADSYFSKAAAIVAKSWDIVYKEGMLSLEVTREQLVAGAASIANASAQALEKAFAASVAKKTQEYREVFKKRIKESFGEAAFFDFLIQGRVKEWKIDAVLRQHEKTTSLFEYVSPSFNSVASAHIKLADIKALPDAPNTVIVLRDYEKTEEGLRSILSSSADKIISFSADAETYRKAA